MTSSVPLSTASPPKNALSSAAFWWGGSRVRLDDFVRGDLRQHCRRMRSPQPTPACRCRVLGLYPWAQAPQIRNLGLRMRSLVARLLLVASVAICTYSGGGPALSAAETPLRIAVGSMPSGKNNPFDAPAISRLWFYSAVFDALTFMTQAGQVVPWLAASWERQSPTVWIFKLRPGVVFSDGSPLNSQIVKQNLDYLRSPSGLVEMVATFAGAIQNVVVVDDTTVRIETTRPDPVLPRKLSLIRIVILPDGGSFDRSSLVERAIGTGPYKVDRWNVTGVEFSAAPASWRRAPTQFLSAITLPNPNTRRSALASGRVDIALAAFGGFDFQDTTRHYRIKREPLPSVVGLAYNTTNNVALRDERVRIALDLAVNREKIVEKLYYGRATVAAQPARREYFGYNPGVVPRPYDPRRARALLAEAGYGGGLDLKMILTSGTSGWDELFEVVADELRKVGVNLTVQAVPEQVMAAYQRNGIPADAFAAAFASPTMDALEVMRQHSCLRPNAWYCDKETMRLIEEADGTDDLEKREQLTRDLQARAHDTAQAMFLRESVGLAGYSRRIELYHTEFGFPRYELLNVRPR